MTPAQILAYYAREDVQQALVDAGRDREVVGVFKTGAFGTRPNMLLYPGDVLAQARAGAIEFHCSLERWERPMLLQTEERKGFDLVFDLDGKDVEHGKAAAQALVTALERHGIRHVSVKFSGNRGFHLGIPWESIPKEVGLVPTARLFPDAARKVSLYLRESIRDDLTARLLKRWTVEQLEEIAGRPVATKEGIDPFKVVDIDPILISPRHLYRMPYSLNKKSFLVSLPLRARDLEGFEKSQADPATVQVSARFLERGEEGEADALFAEGLDWFAKRKQEQRKPGGKRTGLTKKVPESMFPPCMKTILLGIRDGKRRSVFALVNFLSAMKWSWEDIEVGLLAWNRKNTPPLQETYLTQQLRYYRDKKKFPPPNCTQEGWYDAMGVCAPDKVCVARENIKNPVNYPFRILRARARDARQAPKRPTREPQGPRAERDEREPL
ncbi:MAG: hypothetical protein HY369_05285 [Candidatus Aenigmarchaeota archaeon]|nr:hypothetical protein [Candidatus Aenigmarchaeota archaeon]